MKKQSPFTPKYEIAAAEIAASPSAPNDMIVVQPWNSALGFDTACKERRPLNQRALWRYSQ